LSVAYSDDGRLAAVGSRDAVVRIFEDVRANSKVAADGNNGLQPSNMVNEFRGHKGAIPVLCFQSNTPQLFSASEDRCIRSYNLDEMMQLELGVTIQLSKRVSCFCEMRLHRQCLEVG
jgi:WD40 repeat protein